MNEEDRYYELLSDYYSMMGDFIRRYPDMTMFSCKSYTPCLKSNPNVVSSLNVFAARYTKLCLPNIGLRLQCSIFNNYLIPGWDFYAENLQTGYIANSRLQMCRFVVYISLSSTFQFYHFMTCKRCLNSTPCLSIIVDRSMDSRHFYLEGRSQHENTTSMYGRNLDQIEDGYGGHLSLCLLCYYS